MQSILVVTFTKAATAELRDRIRARIVEALAVLRGAASGGDPFVTDLLASVRAKGLQDEQIERQLELARATFDEASIFTIHGFCQRALADTPFAAQMPLALELLENDARPAARGRERLLAQAHRGRRAERGTHRLPAGRQRHARDAGPTARAPAVQAFVDPALARGHRAAPRRSTLAPLRAAHSAAREEWPARKDDILRRCCTRTEAASRGNVQGGSLKPRRGRLGAPALSRRPRARPAAQAGEARPARHREAERRHEVTAARRRRTRSSNSPRRCSMRAPPQARQWRPTGSPC